MWGRTSPPPADSTELRAALANVGELLVQLSGELTQVREDIKGLRKDLAINRISQLADEGRAINLSARVEAIEAQLGT